VSNCNQSALLRATLLFVGLIGLGRPSVAQAPACTYDECALRLQSGQLVRGLEGKRVARLGLFPPRIAIFEQGSDSVRAHYSSFRSAQRTGAIVQLVGLAATTTGAIIVLAQGRPGGAGEVLFLGGFGLSFGGSFAFRSSGNHLSHAVWWYNRELVRAR
jgi:hypothetical protein